MNYAVLACIRDSDWVALDALISAGRAHLVFNTPTSSVFEWLIDLNAPTSTVISYLKYCTQLEKLDFDSFGLLEFCLSQSSTKSFAYSTFAALLGIGLSPNVLLTDRPSTLLQEAMELNKISEVKMLLEYGADPGQRSVNGMDSKSNLAAAALIDNEAANLALRHFEQPHSKAHRSKYS